ncbi:MAG: ComEA family DNA-binding protein [Pseudomonadota bacterium]|nr:ComEA family DNA-binding protein [Pseudomonadota bacterium]
MKKLLITLVTMLAFPGAVSAAVNINTATQAELQTLPGISAATAKAIIEYRAKAGAFRSTDDLEKVGDNIDMRVLRSDITITGPTRVQKEASPASK